MATNGRFHYQEACGTVGGNDVSKPHIEEVSQTQDQTRVFKICYTYVAKKQEKCYLAVLKDGEYHLIVGTGYDILPVNDKRWWSSGQHYDAVSIREQKLSDLTLI